MINIYPAKSVEYASAEEAEAAMDNVAVYDGELAAWEYTDDNTPEYFVVEADQELAFLTHNCYIMGKGEYERTADNVFKYIVPADKIFDGVGSYGIYDRTADLDEFIEFSNARVVKIGQEFFYENKKY